MASHSHLDALNLRLSHERDRLARAKTERERALRKVWVAQCEKEIVGERKVLGLSEAAEIELSDDDLLRELGAA